MTHRGMQLIAHIPGTTAVRGVDTQGQEKETAERTTGEERTSIGDMKKDISTNMHIFRSVLLWMETESRAVFVSTHGAAVGT